MEVGSSGWLVPKSEKILTDKCKSGEWNDIAIDCDGYLFMDIHDGNVYVSPNKVDWAVVEIKCEVPEIKQKLMDRIFCQGYKDYTNLHPDKTKKEILCNLLRKE